MNEPANQENLLSKAKWLSIQLGAILLDSVFLCLWALMQYGVDVFVIKRLKLSTLETGFL